MLDYRDVAKQAALWCLDPGLAPHMRVVGSNVAGFADILADPLYGCPGEHEAAEVMYRCLCRAVEGHAPQT